MTLPCPSMPLNERLSIMFSTFQYRAVLFAIVVSCCSFQNALSDSYRYIDDAGNIFFVDSPSDVPAKYRIQLNPPTPTPSLNKRQAAQYQKEVKRLQAQREKERKRREREIEAERRRQIRSADIAARQKPKATAADTKVKRELPLFFTSPNCALCEKQEAFLTKNKIKFVRHDIVKSAVSFQLFDSLDVGSELPVMKFGRIVVKGFQPDALVAAYQGKEVKGKAEDLASAPNNPEDLPGAKKAENNDGDEITPDRPS